MRKSLSLSPQARTLLGLLLCASAFAGYLQAEAPPAAARAFDTYAAALDAALAKQHSVSGSWLAPAESSDTTTRLQRGEVILKQIAVPPGTAPGALLHHWRGTAFAPGATAADFEHLLRNFNAYPQHFAPDVVQASTLSGAGDHWQMRMRVRQHHVITVVLDGTYDVNFSPPGAPHGFVTSRSTRMDEIAAAGTRNEHPLAPHDEHGFLWRQNTYWTYEERDGGLYVQIESVSLTRAIPHGLGWAVGPYIESIPRESLEFTLRSATAAIRRETPRPKGTQ